MRCQVPIGLQPDGGLLYRCPDCCSIWPSDSREGDGFRCCDKREVNLLGTLADYLGCDREWRTRWMVTTGLAPLIALQRRYAVSVLSRALLDGHVFISLDPAERA